jgi:hypothetical protein
MKKQRITAQEFMEKLNKDPDYLRRKEEIEKARQKVIAEERKETEQLIREINDAGIRINHIGDFIALENGTYENAIPILMKHLRKEYSRENVNSIVRALIGADPNPKVAHELLEMFKIRKYSDEEINYLICSAVASTCTINNLEEIKEVLADYSYGFGRSDLIKALAKLEHLRGNPPKAIPMIVDLLDDKTISYVAIDTLGRLNAYEARDKISSFLNDERQHIREIARKVLKKFDKKSK